MSKKRAILFFGSLTMLIAVYVAWSTRGLYLHAAVPEMSEVPAEYRADARAMILEQGLTRANAFGAKDVWTCLMRPFEASKEVHGLHVYQKRGENFEVGVTRPRPVGGFWPDEKHLIFYRHGDGWKAGVYSADRKGGLIWSRPLEKR